MQGCLPSHLIFLRRHSSHARVTRRRFWTGSEGPSPEEPWWSPSSPEGSDFRLPPGDWPSLPCQLVAEFGPESSSDMMGDSSSSRACDALLVVDRPGGLVIAMFALQVLTVWGQVQELRWGGGRVVLLGAGGWPVLLLGRRRPNSSEQPTTGMSHAQCVTKRQADIPVVVSSTGRERDRGSGQRDCDRMIDCYFVRTASTLSPSCERRKVFRRDDIN